MINHHLYKNVSKKDISDQSIKEIYLHRRAITYKKISKISQETKKEIANINYIQKLVLFEKYHRK